MIAAGRLAADDAKDLALTEVPVSEDLAAPEMAVRAAGRVLADTGWDPARIALVAHGWTYHQGHDFWSPAHYIADQIDASAALPVGVRQMSNSGAAALGIAVDRLTADPDAEAALVTTADRFSLPGFDRWSADYGVVYGDAGTAGLLRRPQPDGPGPGPGSLLLRSLAFVTDASFEEMYRGRDPFSDAPLAHADGRVDVKRPKKAYLEMRAGIEEFRQAAARCVDRVLRLAVSDAGLDIDDPRIVRVALPRLSDSVLDLMYRPVLDGVVRAEVLTVRESSGHLGAGDLLANVEHLVASGALRSGDIALVLGGGGGFTWSCAVLEAP
ncbi:ketoacyl-ACP synthase III family protein [Streptomyces sp. NBC_01565]|uniref:ketoacyl-ACP synthase III family protein n=1 Tax=unclassified Streptomyces TaxID=2593676 RepID=UPI0022527AA8|nr:ketoacyl-ACP synthase III family protein [Streptomyces sp. NBC_01565]MCX4546085.1 ketoacyl-ACP synthase III family protein [Streptomyces sp. NBC_01565]